MKNTSSIDVDSMADLLGMGLDFHIKPIVKFFNNAGFVTSQSCAGHIIPDHGLSYPWIEVCSPDEDFSSFHARFHNHIMRLKCELILKVFNFLHFGKVGLTIEPIGIYGAFRVIPSNKRSIEVYINSEKDSLREAGVYTCSNKMKIPRDKSKLFEGRKAFLDFARFLS